MDEARKYISLIGMLMYLANDICPDISHAVHACARYTHNRKKSHATVVKHILRYLKGFHDKGLVLKPNKKQALDRYVDSNFTENYSHYDDQDPSSTKSRNGYGILYQWCQIFWVSKCKCSVHYPLWKVNIWYRVNLCTILFLHVKLWKN